MGSFAEAEGLGVRPRNRRFAPSFSWHTETEAISAPSISLLICIARRAVFQSRRFNGKQQRLHTPPVSIFRCVLKFLQTQVVSLPCRAILLDKFAIASHRCLDARRNINDPRIHGTAPEQS